MAADRWQLTRTAESIMSIGADPENVVKGNAGTDSEAPKPAAGQYLLPVGASVAVGWAPCHQPEELLAVGGRGCLDL